MADILLYRADGVCDATEQGRRPLPRAVAHDREQLRRPTIEEAEPVKPQRNATVFSWMSYKIRLR